MRKIFISTAIIITMASCTDPNGATKCLEGSGYTEITTNGYDFFNGSKDDFYKTKFRAKAINGEVVTGCVTKGIFKGSTIRLND